MLLKIITFAAAAIPLILFVRAVLFRRPSKLSQTLKEFKHQIDLGIWLFLGLIGCVAAFTLARLAWAWWTAA